MSAAVFNLQWDICRVWRFGMHAATDNIIVKVFVKNVHYQAFIYKVEHAF